MADELTDEQVFGVAQQKELSDDEVFGKPAEQPVAAQSAAPSEPIIPRSGTQMDSLGVREGQPFAGQPPPNEAAANLEAEHPILQHAAAGAAETIQGLIPTTAGQLGEFAASFDPRGQAVKDIVTTGKSLYDVLFGGKSIEEANITNRPEAATLAEVDKTPAFSQERFKAGFDVLAQMGMAAAVSKGLQPKPGLQEIIEGKTETVAPESAITEAAVEAKPTIPEDTGAFPGISKAAEDVRRTELNAPTTGELNASEITSPESVTQPEVRPSVGEEAPLRQQGETPEARQGTEAGQAQEVVPPEIPPSGDTPKLEAQAEKPLAPAEAEAAPTQEVAPKPSKIGQSIEAKAVEAKLTKGFSDTAGYDPITIKDQAQRATNLIESAPADARAIVRGEAPLPEGLRGTSLITAMEEQLLKKPDAQLAYELANSPLTSATSAAAQEMRLMAERVPDSLAAKFQEIRTARQEGSKLRGETPERLFQDIRKEVVRQSSKRPTWEAFVRSIEC